MDDKDFEFRKIQLGLSGIEVMEDSFVSASDELKLASFNLAVLVNIFGMFRNILGLIL